MKRLFKSKKIMTGAIAIMVGVTILLSGLAYAWFSSSGSADTSNALTLGTIKVHAEVSEASDTVIPVMPGLNFPTGVGFIQDFSNAGSIGTLIRFKLKLDVYVHAYDANGDLLPKDQWQKVPEDQYADIIYGKVIDEEQVIDGITYYEPGMWLFMDDDLTMDGLSTYLWGWLDDGWYYIMSLDNNPDDLLHFAYEIYVDGPGVGNGYQNAVMQLSLEWEAVQSMPDDAVLDVFEIDFNDIDFDNFTGFAWVVR